MRTRKNGRQTDVPPACRRSFCGRMALMTVCVLCMLGGCGTSGDAAVISSDAVVSESAASMAVSESISSKTSAKSTAEEEDDPLWKEESLPSPEEWAASAASEAGAGGMKEQTEELMEGVQGLMDRLNRIRGEV